VRLSGEGHVTARRSYWIHPAPCSHRKADACGEEKNLAEAIEARRRTRCERDE
jgi:hypothetical protein